MCSSQQMTVGNVEDLTERLVAAELLHDGDRNVLLSTLLTPHSSLGREAAYGADVTTWCLRAATGAACPRPAWDSWWPETTRHAGWREVTWEQAPSGVRGLATAERVSGQVGGRPLRAD